MGLLEAPFLLGTLTADNPVLSDRDYTFAEVDSELEGLQFTRWKYGPVQTFDLEPTQGGRIYLILPPEQYSRPLPNVALAGWTKSDLTCSVRTVGGIIRPCQVFYRDVTKGPLSVATSPAVWPLLAAKHVNRKGRILGEVVNNPETPPNIDPTDPGPEPKDPGGEQTPPPPAKIAKLAVPTTAEQQPIQTRIASVFELNALETSEAKIAVAKRMYEAGREPSDKHVERFVMLATAARLAADAGDLLTALRSVEEIDKTYEAKTAAMQLYLVQQFADARIAKTLKEQQLVYVVPVLDRGLANDEFDAVDKTVTELFNSGLSHKQLGDRRRIAREMKAKYRVVAAAKERLKTDPDDGAANKVVGEYICFQKVDWDTGLPMLAKSDVPQLRDLAQADLDGPEEAAEQLKVGEGWYKIAEEQDSELAQGAILTRAEDWFRKALAKVEGLNQAHAKKRLDEIKVKLVDLGWVDIPKKATIAAVCGYSFEMYLNGERVLSASYGVGTGDVTVKRGDLLMVRANKSTSTYSSTGRGFACVIKYEGADQPQVTGQSNQWEAFVPSNQAEWYKPESVARTVQYVVSPSAGHTELTSKTGVAARSIWYAGGDTSDAYFVFRVK